MSKLGKTKRNKSQGTKKPYSTIDEVLYDKVYDRNMHARILFNDMGYYVDIRRYKGLFPSTYGIRIRADDFQGIADGLINKINEIKYGPGAPPQSPQLNLTEEEEKMIADFFNK